MTPHFNVIKKFGRKVSKKGDIYYDKQTYSIKNPYNKNEETGTLRNGINCGDIGTLKLHIIHVLLKWPPILTVYDVII